MGKLKVYSMVLGQVQTNFYMAVNEETKETLLIDPADGASYIIRQVEQLGLKPVAILLTHGHFDHILAVNDLKARYDIPVYIHEDEKDVLADPSISLCEWIGGNVQISVDHYVKDGQILDLAGFKVKVLHTPGHTKGGACFYIEDEKAVFAGDTLFNCSIGRTDFPTGNTLTLLASIREKLFVLPDDTNVFPGHEGTTTIGYEKKHNPFL